MKSVMVLQHAASETIAAIADPLAAARVHVETVETFSGDHVPPRLAAHAGLIVMGGPMSVYEHDRYPFIHDELALIRDAITAGKPVLGICLGSQLIAAALGAPVYPGRQKEIGFYQVRLQEGGRRDPVFADVPSSFTALHWHGDIFDVPKDATPLMSSDMTDCQGFRFGTRTWGLLCHLEVTAQSVADMVSAFPEELNAAGVDATALLHAVPEHLPALASIGRGVFSRWTALLT